MNFRNKKNKNKWSKIQYKLLKINTLNIFFFFFKFYTWQETQSKESLQVDSDSAELFAFPSCRIWCFTSIEPPPPHLPLSPIVYSSLVRHLSKTYSTKCPISSPGANKCVFFNQAWLQSTTLNTTYTSSLISTHDQESYRCIETLQCQKKKKKKIERRPRRDAVISVLKFSVCVRKCQTWSTRKKCSASTWEKPNCCTSCRFYLENMNINLL